MVKEFKKNGFPLDRVVSLFGGAGEEGMQVAGWDAAQGYLGIPFTEAGRDVPVIQDIVTMYQAERQEVPDYVGWTTYNLQSPLTISNGQYVVTIPNNNANVQQLLQVDWTAHDCVCFRVSPSRYSMALDRATVGMVEGGREPWKSFAASSLLLLLRMAHK